LEEEDMVIVRVDMGYGELLGENLGLGRGEGGKVA